MFNTDYCLIITNINFEEQQTGRDLQEHTILSIVVFLSEAIGKTLRKIVLDPLDMYSNNSSLLQSTSTFSSCLFPLVNGG